MKTTFFSLSISGGSPSGFSVFLGDSFEELVAVSLFTLTFKTSFEIA
jgi:hypothetical protein